jgi:tetratricopeptide (TPR) repeat protein
MNTSQCKHLLSLVHDVLGCVANGTNNPGASMKHNRRFFDLRVEIALENGENDALLAYAHNQLGCSWMMAKMYEQGAELFELALAIWKNLPSYHEGDASMEYANLGLAYWLQGDIERASKVLEEGYQARVDGYGENDTESFR